MTHILPIIQENYKLRFDNNETMYPLTMNSKPSTIQTLDVEDKFFILTFWTSNESLDNKCFFK